MNSLEAIEKLRIGHEQEAQQCIEMNNLGLIEPSVRHG